MAKKKLLIIEDEENIAKAQSLILGDDFDIHHALDGETGLKMAKELKPDVIILDLMLPKRGGYDVCFHIRGDEAMAGTKIVMVTAKTQEIDEQKGMFIGADVYVKKPFEAEELVNAVNQVLEK